MSPQDGSYSPEQFATDPKLSPFRIIIGGVIGLGKFVFGLGGKIEPVDITEVGKGTYKVGFVPKKPVKSKIP